MSNKLDRLVAEMVMNAPVCDTSEEADAVTLGSVFVVPWYVPRDGNPMAMKWVDRGDGAYHQKRWSPSSDISAAWEVINEMQRCHWDYDVWNEGTVHWCFFGRKTHDDIESPGEFSGTTPALAICLAALRACGVPEPEIQEAMQ